VSVAPTDDHLSVFTGTTVVSGQTTSVTLTAVPGAQITTTVRDASTGAPLPNVCLWPTSVSWPSPFSPGPDRQGSGSNPACSDETGKVVLTGLLANSYNIFAQAGDGVHGHQWVGPHGGTGQKEQATVVTLTTGQAATVPDVRMDKAGSLTGVVRDQATGAGVEGAKVTS